MKYKLINDINMRKVNEDTSKFHLLIVLENFHREEMGQVNAIVTEYFKTPAKN